MSAVDPLLVERLRDALATGPRLRLAVLFGSRATGRAHAESDCDIGVLPEDPDLTLSDELTLAAALEGATGLEVDLVRLDRADPVLGREIARDGVCLMEADRGELAAYRARAISSWLDFEETIAPHRARLLERLTRAQS